VTNLEAIERLLHGEATNLQLRNAGLELLSLCRYQQESFSSYQRRKTVDDLVGRGLLRDRTGDEPTLWDSA
jgi:hypothetical protein